MSPESMFAVGKGCTSQCTLSKIILNDSISISLLFMYAHASIGIVS